MTGPLNLSQGEVSNILLSTGLNDDLSQLSAGGVLSHL